MQLILKTLISDFLMYFHRTAVTYFAAAAERITPQLCARGSGAKRGV
jgi:hypothetical protein